MNADKSKPSASTSKLHRAYKASSPKETSQVYDDWAAEYEQHMKDVGFTHPAMVAAMTARHVCPSEDRVLDAGAGTGILGEILPALGYPNIVGLDASAGMLKIANSKNNYRQLTQQFLGKPLTFADNEFALVVSSGVFTQGHAPLDGLDELIRVTRPGGHLVFSIARTYLQGLFEQKRRQLEQHNKWRFVDASQRYNSTPLDDSLIARVFVFEVL